MTYVAVFPRDFLQILINNEFEMSFFVSYFQAVHPFNSHKEYFLDSCMYILIARAISLCLFYLLMHPSILYSLLLFLYANIHSMNSTQCINISIEFLRTAFLLVPFLDNTKTGMGRI